MANTGGFDLAAGWASASMAYRMTPPNGEPMFQPPAFFDLQGSNTIAGAVGTALYHRERTGNATDIDVSLLNVGMWALSPDIMAGPVVGAIPAPARESTPNPLTNSYPTADGRWLYLVCLQSDRFWGEVCDVLGRPDLAADERFTDQALRARNSTACVAEIERTTREQPLEEWKRRFEGFTGVWAPVLSPAEVHEHVQVAANGYLPTLTSVDGIEFRLPVPPAQYGSEPPVPQGPAPELGQHTEEILLELGKDWDVISELRVSGALG
jgi:formyl-CoA transferase